MNINFSEWMQERISHMNLILVDHFSESRFSIAPQMTQATIYPLQTGGKRIRPLFVYAAAEALGASMEQLKYCDIVAKAIEFIHTYSLVHDDLPCMDDDDTRRGKPTVHKVYSEGVAVLVGDALLTEAFASCAQLPSHILKEILPLMSTCASISGMIGGQSLDIGFEKKIATIEDLQKLHLAKTGALIRCSVEMGGICTGATIEQRFSLREYGALVGLAFQLADDVLDAEEDAEKNKTGDGPPNFVAFLGKDKTYQQAQSCVQQAISLIEQFHNPIRLQQLAHFTVERTF
jgi:geranylgeranyl pyrophosphate synthase